MACFAVIDDDLAMDILSDSLRFRGHEAYRISSVTEALHEIDKIVCADLIVLDIILPWPEDRPANGWVSASNGGMEVLREIRKRKPTLPIIVYSATQDATVIKALATDPCTSFLSKWSAGSLNEFIRRIFDMLKVSDETQLLRPFIVHGHNDAAKFSLKNFLQNTLHFPEPIILHEQPSLGRTIIEKFEDYAGLSSIVFVLLTPDDLGSSNGTDPNDKKRRARQNVIFEMGYFLGILGRRSGRVLLLYQGNLELPSDLSGVIYIDISGGVEAAGEEIRREVQNVR